MDVVEIFVVEISRVLLESLRASEEEEKKEEEEGVEI